MTRRGLEHADGDEREVAFDPLQHACRGRVLGPDAQGSLHHFARSDILLLLDECFRFSQLARRGDFEAPLPVGRSRGRKIGKLAEPQFEHAAGRRVVAVAQIRAE